MKQPEYWKLDSKILARLENVTTYRKLTGRSSLPSDRGYWTLCNYQPLEQGTEIVQLEGIGFLKKSQFYGVDWSDDVIKHNQQCHPEANWHCGDWLKVIRDRYDFCPGLIYLDSTNFADGHGATGIVASTMHLCPSDTVLLVNVMLNDPRSRRVFKPDILIKNISKSVGSLELRKWSSCVENFKYNATHKTEMMTYVFHKR